MLLKPISTDISIVCTPTQSKWLDENLISMETKPDSDETCLNLKNSRRSRTFKTSTIAFSEIIDGVE